MGIRKFILKPMIMDTLAKTIREKLDSQAGLQKDRSKNNTDDKDRSSGMHSAQGAGQSSSLSIDGSPGWLNVN